MKEKISISVDTQTLETIDALVKQGNYRNRSHAFEHSIRKIVGSEQNEK